MTHFFPIAEQKNTEQLYFYIGRSQKKNRIIFIKLNLFLCQSYLNVAGIEIDIFFGSIVGRDFLIEALKAPIKHASKN
jgi:hypothetical protein